MVRTSDVLLILVAILFPPAAAAIVTGCSCDLLINILLTILGYIPGHIHAFWLIYKKIQAEERYGNGGFPIYRQWPIRTFVPWRSPEGHHAQAVPAQQAPYYGATGR